jgi:hypothetical protein
MPLADSPMTRLVIHLDGLPAPHTLRASLDPAAVRQRVYQAAADELAFMRRFSRPYDPAADTRFKWALEWVDILAATRRGFTYGLEASMRFSFMPVDVLLSPKDLAAGERPDFHTLAQGS